MPHVQEGTGADIWDSYGTEKRYYVFTLSGWLVDGLSVKEFQPPPSRAEKTRKAGKLRKKDRNRIM